MQAPNQLSPDTNTLARRVIAFIGRQAQPAWLVGGYVRDRLLGRPSHDLDVIVPQGGIRLARAIAAEFRGASFALDPDRDVGRAIVGDAATGTLEVDVARLRVPDLLDDLALRDFTVNAIAMDISGDAADPRVFDPFDGRVDLTRELVRAVTEGTFRDDPLRILRGVRMVAELGFHIEDATFSLMRRDTGLLAGVASERVRDELLRILTAPGAWQHLRLLHLLGVLDIILPEAAAQVGVEQSTPHYQDAFDHTRSVLAHLEGILALLWPDSGYAVPQPVAGDATVLASAAQWAELAEVLAPFAADLCVQLTLPLSAEHIRRDLLMWAALTHDWGKPAKRMVEDDGRTHFYDHDHWGALLAQSRLQALKFSGDEAAYVARLTDQHMRPVHLAHDYPPSRKAVYRFFKDAEGTGPDCVLLSLADHLATRAAAPEDEPWRRRLDVTTILLQAYFRERPQRVDPPLLLNGRQVMAELGLPPSPKIGELLAGLREAQATGEVTSLEEAWSWLKTAKSG